MEPEPEERPSIEYTDIDLNENFEEWLSKKVDPIKYKGLMGTLTHFRENELIATFKNDSLNISYKIEIKGKGDEDGISFDFYRFKEGQWRFGIDIEDVEITDIDGELLELKGLGYARFLMVIMIYYLENYIDKPIDLKLPGSELTIGICADASGGFWEYMGMNEGKYSMDKDRYNSMTGPNCGYDKDFQMKDWESWLFSDSKKRARKKKKKHKKKKTKRKKKRKSKKSKMR
jgi:hypothetical protein